MKSYINGVAKSFEETGVAGKTNHRWREASWRIWLAVRRKA